MYKGLYECFKHWYRGGNIWLYSDPHFGDDEMKYIRTNYIDDDEQVKRINSKVGKNDTIIFLGDICDTDYIKKIRGYKILIMGNHDAGASNYQRVRKNATVCPHCGCEVSTDAYNTYYENGNIYYTSCVCSNCGKIVNPKFVTLDNRLFDEVYEGPLMINNKIMLSHEPVRELPFIYNIHGHEHSGKKSTNNSLNVCAEHIDYTPISLLTLIKNGCTSKIENIHRTTIDKAIIRKGKYN